MSFLLETGDICIAFRGTDSTLVGWKEDFNMSFLPVIPSQHDALEYVEQISEHYKGRLYICGHSKGGNLAVYASAFAVSYTHLDVYKRQTYRGEEAVVLMPRSLV